MTEVKTMEVSSEAESRRPGLDLQSRPRRLRRTEGIRDLVRENSVTPADLIYPLFVVPDDRPKTEISSMPGVYQLRVPEIVEEAVRAADLGIRGVLLFGIPSTKDATGSSSWDEDGPVQRAVRAIREGESRMTVITDVCMCEYTDHGHCGIVREGDRGWDVVNDETVDLLVRQSLSFARAGADFVAPSDMMDGRVGAIRRALDVDGFTGTGLIAYSAKFSSAFYGPFREAAESAPRFGDRRSYQMDPANSREAMREIDLDVREGADMVMVKPALAYLDLVREARRRFEVPIVAYNVSGEYSMVKAAAARGWIDGDRITDEILLSMKRAGADLVITYAAVDFAERFRRSTA